MHPTNNTHLFPSTVKVCSVLVEFVQSPVLRCYCLHLTPGITFSSGPARQVSHHRYQGPENETIPIALSGFRRASFQVSFKQTITPPYLDLPWRVTHQCSEPTASHKETFSKTGAENTMLSPTFHWLCRRRCRGAEGWIGSCNPKTPQDIRRYQVESIGLV